MMDMNRVILSRFQTESQPKSKPGVQPESDYEYYDRMRFRTSTRLEYKYTKINKRI